jgi:hypothetical protein
MPSPVRRRRSSKEREGCDARPTCQANKHSTFDAAFHHPWADLGTSASLTGANGLHHAWKSTPPRDTKGHVMSGALGAGPVGWLESLPGCRARMPFSSWLCNLDLEWKNSRRVRQTHGTGGWCWCWSRCWAIVCLLLSLSMFMLVLVFIQKSNRAVQESEGLGDGLANCPCVPEAH